MKTPNRFRFVLLMGAVLGLLLAACNTTPPPAETRNLTVNVTGNGSVVSDPAGIDTDASQVHAFAKDAVVELTATADAGWQFDSWTGACAAEASNVCDVTMDVARTTTAVFTEIIVPPTKHTLTVAFVGDGSGTVTSTDTLVNCDGSGTCEVEYDEGTAVTLQATADAGTTFVSWDQACSGTGDCDVTLDADTFVVVVFALDTSIVAHTGAVLASEDDAEEFLTDVNPTNLAGTTRTTSGDLDLLYDDATGYPVGSVASEQIVGLRFDGVAVPTGAYIVSATITFTGAADSSADPVTMVFHGEASATPASYTGGPSNTDISSRATTTASVSWDAPVFNTDVEAASADLSAIVAEIIDLAGWTSGNAMAFVVSAPAGQTAFRLAYAFDDAANAPAVLTIEYYVPPIS